MYNRLQEKKDETCSKEQVTTIREIIQDEEYYDDTFKERKRSQTQCNYVTLLSDIINAKPSSYEEVAKNKGKESTSSRRMMSKMWYRDLKRSLWDTRQDS